MTFLSILIGKIIIFILKLLNRGSGTALPGLISLKLKLDLLSNYKRQFNKGIILISATNGKTTTASLITKIFEDQNLKIIQNISGSNLERGIASALIKKSNLSGKIEADYGIFEVDEAALPRIIFALEPKVIILNNLFRDQLDRYGELDTIAKNWKEAIARLNEDTTLILNADDPVIACLPSLEKGKSLKVKTKYYGISGCKINRECQHHADSIFCPACYSKLKYKQNIYSHIGIWSCPSCANHNPEVQTTAQEVIMEDGLQKIVLTCPKGNEDNEHCVFQRELKKEKCACVMKTKLLGIYNAYNVLSAFTVGVNEGFDPIKVIKSIQDFEPAFGRQEKLKVKGKEVFILLSKNPTGFSESIRAIQNLEPKNLFLILNDKIADGEDVSWISDIDFSGLNLDEIKLTFSGTRAHEMALRLKYEMETPKKMEVVPDFKRGIARALEKIEKEETLFILPTYTAMLEVRKILTGKSLR